MTSDIDFDELDKAVNSLMGGVKPQDRVDDDAPKAKTLEVKDTLQPGEDPKYDKLGEVASSIGSETLDGEREKTVVEEFTPDADPDEAPAPRLPIEEKPVEPAPTERPPAVRRPTNGSRFMDVVHPALDMKATTPPPSFTTSRTISSVSTPVEPPSHPDDQPPLTPFLPDANAKVEKRPLGGVDPEPEPEVPVDQATEQAIEPVNVPPAEPVSEDSEQNVQPAAAVPELSEEESLLQSIESRPIDESILDEASIRNVESGDTGTIHNDEQRDSHKKSHDKQTDANAIFDTENYHKPLKTAPKKKMGALKITGIVLLVIVLSAAVGAGAVYILFGMGL